MSTLNSISIKHTRRSPPLVNQAWRRFHAWIASAAGMLLITNIFFLIQPMPSSKNSGAQSRTIYEGRAPASTAGVDTASRLGLTEIQVGCEPLQAIEVASTVRQIRLLLTPCSAPIRTIRNETNGFEATLFSGTSTDYLSLAVGENQIVIDRTEITQRLKIVKASISN